MISYDNDNSRLNRKQQNYVKDKNKSQIIFG